MKPKSVSKQLDDLAAAILNTASLASTPLADKLEAFKIVSAYHVAVMKASKGIVEDAVVGASFDKLRTNLRTIGGKDA